MAAGRGTRWRDALGDAVGECLISVLLWTLGTIGSIAAAAVLAAATDAPAVFVPVLTCLVVLLGWGALLTVRHRPGLYLDHLTESRRAALGSGWVRKLRLTAIISLQIAAAAVIGYVALRLMFG